MFNPYKSKNFIFIGIAILFILFPTISRAVETGPACNSDADCFLWSLVDSNACSTPTGPATCVSNVCTQPSTNYSDGTTADPIGQMCLYPGTTGAICCSSNVVCPTPTTCANSVQFVAYRYCSNYGDPGWYYDNVYPGPGMNNPNGACVVAYIDNMGNLMPALPVFGPSVCLSWNTTVSCGVSTPFCGDGSCNNGETSYTCQTDCGAPPTCVNDNNCSASDLINGCPDCGGPPSCSVGGGEDCFSTGICGPGFICDYGAGGTCIYGGQPGACGENAENSWAGTVFPYNATAYPVYPPWINPFCMTGDSSPVVGSIPFPTQGGTVSWDCLPINDTLSCISSVTCTARRSIPPPPDLTASGITPNIAYTGNPTSFTSTITNNGGQSTGTSFPNFFQVATAINGGGTITDLASSIMSALASGVSGQATSPLYSFPSAGIYSVRACADKSNSASAGVIGEGGNEGNNCSTPWQTVTVSNLPQVDLSMSAVSITTAPLVSGGSINFRGTVNNIGSAGALASQTRLEIDTDGSGTWTVGEPSATQPTSALAIGGFEVEDLAYTSPAGSYDYRICADSGNAISEPNEVNNCSAWTLFSVAAVSVDGECNTSDGFTSPSVKLYVYNAPGYSSGTFCNPGKGTPSPLTPQFPNQGGPEITWTCSGQNGGNPAICKASRDSAPALARIRVNVTTAGQGTVVMPRPSLPDLSCTSICTVDYADGTPVTLTATPASGRIFVGWTGCDTSTATTNGGTCNVTASGAERTVTAKFSINPNFKEF